MILWPPGRIAAIVGLLVGAGLIVWAIWSPTLRGDPEPEPEEERAASPSRDEAIDAPPIPEGIQLDLNVPRSMGEAYERLKAEGHEDSDYIGWELPPAPTEGVESGPSEPRD